jgi:hypothetical protein
MRASWSAPAEKPLSAILERIRTMKFLKLKNFLLLGATGITILLAAVLLGAGQLVFSGLFLGGGILFFYLWLKRRCPLWRSESLTKKHRTNSKVRLKSPGQLMSRQTSGKCPTAPVLNPWGFHGKM